MNMAFLLNPSEVVFFGDIGSPNADGEQIQAMLQKNEGVTFTFDLSHRQDHENHEIHPEAIRQGMGMLPGGYRAPSNVYNNIPGGHYIQDNSQPIHQGPQPTQPYAMAPMGMQMQPFAHNPGMTISYQAVPVGSVPFDVRPQINGDSSERPTVAATAPPPGFAPLPSANSSMIHPPDMMRSYHPQYAVAAGNVYSMAPVGMNFQQPQNTYSSAPSTTSVTSEAIVGYRPSMDSEAASGRGPGTNLNMGFEPNMISASHSMNANLVQHQQQMTNMPMANYQQQHVMSVPHHGSVQLPNGQVENGDDSGNIGYMKHNQVSAEQLYNPEYAQLIGANATPSNYGMSLSQAHHGPVVSALQMQHSQHHPMQMQGGHFHHHNYQNVRPYMPVGNFAGGYSYPQMGIQQHNVHQENMMQSGNSLQGELSRLTSPLEGGHANDRN